MEQEIRTRWVLPGAFAAGTFLWVAHVTEAIGAQTWSSGWAPAILGLVTAVPAAGFLVASLVFTISGGYDGRRQTSWARNTVARLIGQAPAWQTANLQQEGPGPLAPDILFALATFRGFAPIVSQPMPQPLNANGRRRWTACWAAWNSAAAIILALPCSITYVGLKHELPGHLTTWLWSLVPLLVVASYLLWAGHQARRDAWQLEDAWLLSELTDGAGAPPGNAPASMGTGNDDLLSRYLWLSEQSCRINEVVANARSVIQRMYDESTREDVYLLNDLQLFLVQAMAFDGFVTACLHSVSRSKDDSLTQRVERLASAALRRDKTFQALLSGVDEITKVRDAWVHGQGDPSVLRNPNWPNHLADRFGLFEKDGRLWVRLSQTSRDGRTPWSFVISTLQGMARLVWKDAVAESAGERP